MHGTLGMRQEILHGWDASLSWCTKHTLIHTWGQFGGVANPPIAMFLVVGRTPGNHEETQMSWREHALKKTDYAQGSGLPQWRIPTGYRRPPITAVVIKTHLVLSDF